ncbi:hypothetical protein [Halorussus sp. AFM4]|uniref:hypothetical protein n=1 Tax=Halorussus sp. AFM4 TaxID=3421651 RepID=UPI003EB700D8
MDESAPVQRRGTESAEEDRPLGLTLYVGLYAVAWTLVLVLLPALGLGLLVWLLVPVPVVALYVVYHLWRLKRWAWATLVVLHVVSALLSVVQVAVGVATLAEKDVPFALSILFVGYLYAIRDRFD